MSRKTSYVPLAIELLKICVQNNPPYNDFLKWIVNECQPLDTSESMDFWQMIQEKVSSFEEGANKKLLKISWVNCFP